MQPGSFQECPVTETGEIVQDETQEVPSKHHEKSYYYLGKWALAQDS